jgi:glyoxylase-like metal-dependent hydrolase (beta-lactamase superfamily II)
MEPKYRIHILTTVQTVFSKGLFLYLIPNLGQMTIPALFWYIEGADQHILVDTGGSGEGLPENSQFGAPWEDVCSFEKCLVRVGITPDDVDIVIQTHLHFDHALNTGKCRKAKVYVQKNELAQAKDPHPLTAQMYRWFENTGKDLNYIVVDGDTKLMPGIELLSVPGHSPGCQAVAVNTSKGRAIITGFCSIRENFDPPPPLKSLVPVICPGIHLNAVQAYESLWRVKNQANIILPMHEPGLVGAECI